MQNIIIEKTYHFIPPHYGRFWQWVFGFVLRPMLKKNYGLEEIHFEGLEHVRASLAAGHGILLAPNHSRPCDPMVMGVLGGELGHALYIMASWHLFMQGKVLAWLLPRLGAFSVYREGMDSASVKEAIAILKNAAGPLIIFPEGIVTRTNERLQRFNDGVPFIARTAARQAEKSGRKIVIHPVALRYSFGGDLKKTITPVLQEIEARLTWQRPATVRLGDRLVRIGEALLSLKEHEYMGQPQVGTISERLARLIDHILQPLETEWKVAQRGPDVPNRVRALRTAILPEMIDGAMEEAERQRRWKQLADLYLAQQLCLYPPDYVASRPTVERILETVERFEEDLTDSARPHPPMRVDIRVAPAITVPPEKAAQPDPLLEAMRDTIGMMLTDMGKEARLVRDMTA